MNTKVFGKTESIIKRLEETYPDAYTALKFKDPIQMLVATILSAQCTDVKVNQVTGRLFKKYYTLEDYANADTAGFELDIKPTGFFRSKTRSIISAARLIKERFGGKVPNTMAELITLPGVARKTANIVLYNAYGITEGIAVDTHVRRLSQRLGLTKNNDPNKIEQDLMKLVPRKKWGRISNLLIDHGRAVCMARKPKCQLCFLKDICPSVFKV